MRIVFVFILLFSLSTAANKVQVDKPVYYYKTVNTIKKGSKVVVTDFTKAYGGVFRGFLDKYDGEGFFYFRAEHLAQSLGKDLKTIIKSSKKITGKTITLKKDLKTVLAPLAEEAPVKVTLGK